MEVPRAAAQYVAVAAAAAHARVMQVGAAELVVCCCDRATSSAQVTVSQVYFVFAFVFVFRHLPMHALARRRRRRWWTSCVRCGPAQCAQRQRGTQRGAHSPLQGQLRCCPGRPHRRRPRRDRIACRHSSARLMRPRLRGRLHRPLLQLQVTRIASTKKTAQAAAVACARGSAHAHQNRYPP